MNIAVAILNWNGVSWLKQFLPTVIQRSPEATVYIIDNASTDESFSYVHEQFPNTPWIQLDKNYGFAEGYNRGLTHIDADYFVLLNSDVEVSEHWLMPVITKMEGNENLAVCMPKMKSFQNRTQFEYAGAAGGFIDKFGYPFCHGRVFDTIEEDCGQYDEDCEIFWASGAALFVRSSVYRELGGLDKDFFAHMEEIDFCWRVKNAGYSIQYVHNSEVFHVGGGSLPKENPFKTYLNYRNNLYMLHKNLPEENYKKIIFERRLLDALSWTLFIVKLDWKNAREIIHAHKEYRKNKHLLEEKRKLYPQHRDIPEIYPHSIVWEYFIARKLRQKKNN